MTTSYSSSNLATEEAGTPACAAAVEVMAAAAAPASLRKSRRLVLILFSPKGFKGILF